MNERPNLVMFETRAVEDRQASRDAGHYVAKDVDVIKVTMPGGNMIHEDEAENWIGAKEFARDPFAEYYRQAYNAWKEGQELPVSGTAVKTCPIFSPAEIENLTRLQIRTLEDLVAAPEPVLQRLGMGARSMVTRSKAYMDSFEGGKVAAQVDALTFKLESLMAKVEELTGEIAARDQLLAELEPKKRKSA